MSLHDGLIDEADEPCCDLTDSELEWLERELVCPDDAGPDDDRWQAELFAELELQDTRHENDGSELRR
jgi:hypothetical protein